MGFPSAHPPVLSGRHRCGACGVCLHNTWSQAVAGRARRDCLSYKWRKECCKPGVSSDSAWHTAPTDISLRAVTTQAIRLKYGTAPSKVCWSYCQPGVKLSAWNTAPQDIR